MKTALEALFQAMISGGWANASNGDVASPTGHYARMTNEARDLPEIKEAFSDVLDAYGTPGDEEMVGHFLIREDSQGLVFITLCDTESEMLLTYREWEAGYEQWLAEDESEGL